MFLSSDIIEGLKNCGPDGSGYPTVAKGLCDGDEE
jgi:hypothetical protein